MLVHCVKMLSAYWFRPDYGGRLLVLLYSPWSPLATSSPNILTFVHSDFEPCLTEKAMSLLKMRQNALDTHREMATFAEAGVSTHEEK